jgi:hypothetical protein
MGKRWAASDSSTGASATHLGVHAGSADIPTSPPAIGESLHKLKNRKRQKRGEYVDAFELMSWTVSMTREIYTFLVHRSRAETHDAIKTLAEECHGKIQEGRCRFSILITVPLRLNDTVCGRLDVLPIDAEWTVVAGSPMIGSSHGFQQILSQLERLLDGIPPSA